MSDIIIKPATATAIVRLPPSYASAWSPGFDLHVDGSGETPGEARDDLVRNLRAVADQLHLKADVIERAAP